MILRHLIACAPLALVIACGSDGYGLAVAGDADPLARDAGPLPSICFMEAHTLVVGPGPGCAELIVPGTGPVMCPFTDRGGAPLRVVRRGALPVRLTIVPRCHSEGGCHDAHTRSNGVYRMTSSGGGSCALCGESVSGLGPDGFDFGLGFAISEVDGVAELMLAGDELIVRACTFEPSPAQRAFEARCRESCDACGERVESCHDECAEQAARQEDACLDAWTDGLECMALVDVCVATPERDPCPEEALRWQYECR